MGEIGYDRHAYLYELSFCDILCIERGFNNRYWQAWSRTRWQAFQIMRAISGDDALHKADIWHPSDLIPLPWDRKVTIEPPITDEEAQELLAEMQAMNTKSD